MIGVGLIGTGFMGKCHALAWNSVSTVFGDTPEIKLVHLGEANIDLANKRAKEFGFDKASGDWRAVIADPEVDIVSVTAPNQFHPEMAIEALKAGKHVWCEKPMAPAFAEAEAMAESRSGPARSPCSVTITSRARPSATSANFWTRSHRRRQSPAYRDGRGFHGRPGSAVLLEA